MRGPETEPSHPMKVDGNRQRPRATAPDAPDARADDDRSHSDASNVNKPAGTASWCHSWIMLSSGRATVIV
jgi:hypothetical protein